METRAKERAKEATAREAVPKGQCRKAKRELVSVPLSLTQKDGKVDAPLHMLNSAISLAPQFCRLFSATPAFLLTLPGSEPHQVPKILRQRWNTFALLRQTFVPSLPGLAFLTIVGYNSKRHSVI
jgi:hypothetical protein